MLYLCDGMIDGGIFHTVEFYVIAVVVAAMIVGFVARPAARGEAKQFLLAGDLSYDDEYAVPAITIEVLDSGLVVLRRHAIEDMTTSCAVSLAITIIGWDITIEERLSNGYYTDPAIDTATFYLDFLAPERYHLRYNSESTGLFTATSITIRPGYTITRQLTK